MATTPVLLRISFRSFHQCALLLSQTSSSTKKKYRAKLRVCTANACSVGNQYRLTMCSTRCLSQRRSKRCKISNTSFIFTKIQPSLNVAFAQRAVLLAQLSCNELYLHQLVARLPVSASLLGIHERKRIAVFLRLLQQALEHVFS